MEVKVGSRVDVLVNSMIGAAVAVSVAEGGTDVCVGRTRVAVGRGDEVTVVVNGTGTSGDRFLVKYQLPIPTKRRIKRIPIQRAFLRG